MARSRGEVVASLVEPRVSCRQPERSVALAAVRPDEGCDPLDPDAPDDRPIVTTERRLRRVALVAVDAGARFARERLSYDAAAWMLAPRALFGGARPLEACQELRHFTRGLLLHGLSLGLDADPDDVDALLDEVGDGGPRRAGDALARSEDGQDPFFVDDGRECLPWGSAASEERCVGAGEPRPPRLHTSTVPLGDGGRSVAFCALVGGGPEDLRERLARRYGIGIAADAVIVAGVDRDDRHVIDLVTSTLMALLDQAAEDPEAFAEEGFDVTVERRFA